MGAQGATQRGPASAGTLGQRGRSRPSMQVLTFHNCMFVNVRAIKFHPIKKEKE